jgi:hypothetical protein
MKWSGLDETMDEIKPRTAEFPFLGNNPNSGSCILEVIVDETLPNEM